MQKRAVVIEVWVLWISVLGKTRKESLLNAQESCSDRVASQPETPPQRRLRGRTRPPKGTSGDSSQILNAKGQVWASQQSPVGSTDEGRGSPLRGRSTVCVLQAVHRPATGEHFLRGCSCCRRTRDPPSKIRNGSHWARDTQVKARCCWETGKQEQMPCTPWGGG